MCFGGGASADDIYETIKPDPVKLPSLSMTGERGSRPKYGYKVRTGTARRSLLSSYTVGAENDLEV